MNTGFRRAVVPEEIRSLVIFDRKVFREYPADWFDRDTWRTCDSWWMTIDNRKAGCCAFAPHQDFQEDISADGRNANVAGSLYIVTTGILPAVRGRGLGSLLKQWQLTYARNHGFTRIVTNTRESNLAMIGLNKKFGFTILRTSPDYYEQPTESTVAMELRLR